MDDIEQVFAAQVFNAERNAAAVRATGWRQTAADHRRLWARGSTRVWGTRLDGWVGNDQDHMPSLPTPSRRDCNPSARWRCFAATSRKLVAKSSARSRNSSLCFRVHRISG